MDNDLPLTYIRSVIENALAEDIGHGDITTSLLIRKDQIAEGFITAEDDVIVAGILVAEEVFKTLDPDVTFEALAEDGESISAGTKIIRVHGKAKALLTGERVALNFLQRLSGIATLSRRYTEAVKGLPVRIVDTRKTTPGIRCLEKYAVRVGGCWNHRFGLFDGILIKENHIALTSGVGVATNIVRDKSPHTIKLEVEVKNLEEVREAAEGGADIIMLDNMDIQVMREALSIIRNYKDKEILIEASGGIGLANVRNVALTGVDIISVGALTHSSSCVNISMDIFPLKSKNEAV
jgi:nicotinate-nucleotide pyrophosphorylase (carboxylating)